MTDTINYQFDFSVTPYSLDSQFVFESLVQKNYFPSQKADYEELPPLFTTLNLKKDVCDELMKFPIRRQGYDQIEYRATRYTNVSRIMSIPHPMPYIYLSNCISENWEKINYIEKNPISQIKPKRHQDGRLIIMDYDKGLKGLEKQKKQLELSFGKKLLVKTDIANCFPSIYSHSIPWALVGRQEAKRKKSERNEWFNKLDNYQQKLKRSETQGVPIGPATSNIICEIILAKVDEELRQSGFVPSEKGGFTRYIDDYTGYCKDYESGQEFIRTLGEKLKQYNLLLNIKKTSIVDQPVANSPDWLTDASTRLINSEKISAFEAIRCLDYALSMQHQTPDGSILKYMTKMILSKCTPNRQLILHILSLSFYRPILLPLFSTKLENLNLLNPFKTQLLRTLQESCLFKRSDAMTWTLYYLNSLSFSVPDDIAEKVIETEDCIAITTLYTSKEHDQKVIDFVNNRILVQEDLYTLDQYWLLLYQLFFDDKIVNPYSHEPCYQNYLNTPRDTLQNAKNREMQVFEKFKSMGVTFIKSA